MWQQYSLEAPCGQAIASRSHRRKNNRSAIFFADKEQERITSAYIAQLNKAKVFAEPIATQVAALKEFYPAEEYHQDYAARRPYDLCIVINDAPKVVRLRKLFPDLCTNK